MGSHPVKYRTQATSPGVAFFYSKTFVCLYLNYERMINPESVIGEFISMAPTANSTQMKFERAAGWLVQVFINSFAETAEDICSDIAMTHRIDEYNGMWNYVAGRLNAHYGVKRLWDDGFIITMLEYSPELYDIWDQHTATGSISPKKL